jgi:hypothetical protein
LKLSIAVDAICEAEGMDPLEAAEQSLLGSSYPCCGCAACGETVDGMEPDTDKAACPACGALAVFSIEQLMIRGAIS